MMNQFRPGDVVQVTVADANNWYNVGELYVVADINNCPWGDDGVDHVTISGKSDATCINCDQLKLVERRYGMEEEPCLFLAFYCNYLCSVDCDTSYYKNKTTGTIYRASWFETYYLIGDIADPRGVTVLVEDVPYVGY